MAGARQMLRETLFALEVFCVLYRRTFYDRSVPVEVKQDKQK